MDSPRKTAIVTGASQGIGARIVEAFVEWGFNVVGNSWNVTQSTVVRASDHVALVDGHIGEPATASRIVGTALSRFKSIDVLVNNAGIFFGKKFIDCTAEDFKSLVSTNVEGFLVNAVAPGVVYTPLDRDTPKDVMESQSPMGRPSTVNDITDAVMYLTNAATVTGHILYVDGGAHFGHW